MENDMWQKCEGMGLKGFLFKYLIFKSVYQEEKKIVGAVWDLPAK